MTFPVGSRYNGQTISLYHCVDGSLEVVSAIVENGWVRFTVDSLSPFAVVQTLFIPNTGDKTTKVSYFLLVLSVSGIFYGLRLHKKTGRYQ